MLNDYECLIDELGENKFGRMYFTVYNFADEDGWVNEIGSLNKKCYDYDDLEMMRFTLPVEDIEGLKNCEKSVIGKYNTFKRIIENELQSIPNVAIFVINDIGGVFAVKPKEYNLTDLFIDKIG